MAKKNYLKDLETKYNLTEQQEKIKKTADAYLYTLSDEIKGKDIDKYGKLYKEIFRKNLKEEIKPFLVDLFFLNTFNDITEENKKNTY